MAARKFGAVDLAADTDTVLMTGTTGYDSTVNVRFVNRNSDSEPSSNGAISVYVRLALVQGDETTAISNLSSSDYLEYDAIIPPQDVLEDTGLVVPDGYSLVVRSDTSFVNVVAYGFEEEK